MEESQSLRRDDAWIDLVVSVLSVNNWPLERTYRLMEGLTGNGLANPSNLARLDETEIAERLKLAGYNRGEYMNRLLAARLAGLGTFINYHGVDAATRLISQKERPELERALFGIYGIGPVVIRNFCLLREV